MRGARNGRENLPVFCFVMLHADDCKYSVKSMFAENKLDCYCSPRCT